MKISPKMKNDEKIDRRIAEREHTRRDTKRRRQINKLARVDYGVKINTRGFI